MEYKIYNIAVDVPLIGERAVFSYRSPVLLDIGDLVAVPVGKGDAPRGGIVVGQRLDDLQDLKEISGVLSRGLFPRWYVEFVMEISEKLVVPPFNVFSISYNKKLLDVSYIRILVYTGSKCSITRSPYLNELIEEISQNGFLLWVDVKKKYGSKAGKLWKRLKELGCGVEELAYPRYDAYKASAPWISCGEKEYPLTTALVSWGRKKLRKLIENGICKIVYFPPSVSLPSRDKQLVVVKGGIDSLVEILKGQVGKTLVLVRNRNIAVGLAKKLVRSGISRVISPSLSTSEILTMIVSDTDGIFVLPPGYLFKPWNMLSTVIMYDIDDVKIPLRDGGMLWLPGVALILKKYVPNVVYVSPFPLVGVANIADEVREQSNVENLQIILHDEEAVLGTSMIEAMKQIVERGGRVLIYAGRLGYKTAVLCRNCGYVQRCPRCGMTMVFHIKENHMICHRCGETEKPMEVCPQCGSRDIVMVGTGIELLEEILEKYFSDQLVVISSSSRKKPLKGKSVILSTFRFYRYFYEYPFDMVYIPDIDFMWSFPVYTVWEDTMRMLHRFLLVGKEVIVSTRIPEIWKQRINESFTSFVAREIGERKLLSFPPYSPIMHLEYGHESYEEIEKRVFNYYEFLTSLQVGDVWRPEFIGKFPDGLYRWAIKISVESVINDKLRQFIEKTHPLRYFLLPL